MEDLLKITKHMWLPLALVAGCSSMDGGNGADLANSGSVADLATSSPDLTPNNPANPIGLGPAPVDVGSVGNLAAAGSYVVLAKTGITNVTGSALTRGWVG